MANILHIYTEHCSIFLQFFLQCIWVSYGLVIESDFISNFASNSIYINTHIKFGFFLLPVKREFFLFTVAKALAHRGLYNCWGFLCCIIVGTALQYKMPRGDLLLLFVKCDRKPNNLGFYWFKTQLWKCGTNKITVLLYIANTCLHSKNGYEYKKIYCFQMKVNLKTVHCCPSVYIWLNAPHLDPGLPRNILHSSA